MKVIRTYKSVGNTLTIPRWGRSFLLVRKFSARAEASSLGGSFPLGRRFPLGKGDFISYS